MKVEAIRRQFRCPVCRVIFMAEEEADSCLQKHRDGYARKLPKYKIGDRVVTPHFNHREYGTEESTIIKIRGEFLNLKLLVETEDGERYWVPAVSYHTIDFGKDSAPFHFIGLA